MKRIRLLFALLLVFCSLPYAFAEGHTYSTEKPDAFQFCELYTKRLVELERETGVDLNTSAIGALSHNSLLFNDILDDNLLHANCSGGTIGFDADYYIVQCWDDLLFYMDDDADKKYRGMISSAAAISALEYTSGPDELWMKHFENTTPIEKAFNKIIDPLFDDIDVTIRKIKAQKKRRLIYQGKYDYYIDCWETSDGRDMVMIFAE